MEIYSYLIQSLSDETYYTGISEDPYKRVKEHNLGKVSSTRFRGPYRLVHCKRHNTYEAARKREKWLKKKNRRYKDLLAQLAPPTRGGVK